MKLIATYTFTSEKTGKQTIITFSDVKGEPNYNGTDRIEINSNSTIIGSRVNRHAAKAFEKKLLEEKFVKVGHPLTDYED